jgi:glutamyl-Q tRNA(Asp) synthetase
MATGERRAGLEGGVGGRMCTRFAPSPTGLLHLGHAYSALVGQGRARRAGGRFLLRIEDIDRGRSRREYEEAIYEDLRWLGVEWQGEVWRQSERMGEYEAALGRLREAGLMYPCFCTRREIQVEIEAAGGAPQGADGLVYPGTCRGLGQRERERRLAAGEAHAWRLDVGAALAGLGMGEEELGWDDLCAGPQEVVPGVVGDAVLARKDVPTSYHLAVVCDDAAQGVSEVVRGRDLIQATPLHRLLQRLLGLAEVGYYHHELIVDEAGVRLAKRDGARSLRAMREAGMGVEEVLGLLGSRCSL